MTVNYVLGFVFRKSHTKVPGHDVLLYTKEPGSMHAGLLNGIGGKVEPDEDWLAAMRREWKEESGYKAVSFRRVATLQFSGNGGLPTHVATFAALASGLGVYPPNSRATWTLVQPMHVIGGELNLGRLAPHCSWLIPLCYEAYKRRLGNTVIRVGAQP